VTTWKAIIIGALLIALHVSLSFVRVRAQVGQKAVVQIVAPAEAVAALNTILDANGCLVTVVAIHSVLTGTSLVPDQYAIVYTVPK